MSFESAAADTRRGGAHAVVGAERLHRCPTLDDGISDTELPDSGVVKTDVLVTGSGPAGASAALMLSTLGVRNILIWLGS